MRRTIEAEIKKKKNSGSKFPRVVVAGLSGGSGKTTLSLGLIRAFRKRGLSALAFKKGPDYIDAGWLGAASGGSCYNLDPFLIGRDNIIPSFTRRAKKAGAAISLIEGNRGIFDGMDLKGSQSTATLAGILRSPVVLIMDASKMTRTAAAIVLGVKNFDPGLRLAGVVLNRVAGARHEAMLRSSIESYTGVPVLGMLPKLKGADSIVSERHMGLLAHKEHPEAEAALERACQLVESSVDVEGVIEAARRAPSLRATGETIRYKRKAGIVIGVIQDRAFQFYYPENLEALEQAGATLEIISPLSEKSKKTIKEKFPRIHALYIGGGFPETNALALSKNRGFIRALKERIERGLPVYAECGGLMYLARHIEMDGDRHPMAGIFPFGMAIWKRPVAHGYSIARIREKNPFYPVGTVLRGHEFHYSRPERVSFPPENKAAISDEVRFALQMERGSGIEGGMDGLVYKNVFATYTHTHALGTPEWARGMIKAAEKFRKEHG